MAEDGTSAEVLVIGAGPAGIAAASVAAERGKKVVLLSNAPWLGGQIWRGEEPATAREWLRRLRQSGAKVVTNAAAIAAPAAHRLLAETPAGPMEFEWEHLVIATGARELFLPFPGWILPGVIGAGGLHALAKQGWPIKGKRVVVAGSGPLLLAVAQGLRAHGADVRLIVEQAPWPHILRLSLALMRYPAKLLQGLGLKAKLLGVQYRCGSWPTKAEGNSNLESVTFTDGTTSWREECHYLACGFHLVPNIELPQLLGCCIQKGFVKVNEWQQTSLPGIFCAGEPNGVGGADCALIEGQIAGLAAAGASSDAANLFAARERWQRFRVLLEHAFRLRAELRQLADAQTIVCRCEDVLYGELLEFQDGRAAKLHTRCGMGSCQGRVCGAATQFLFGWQPNTPRPPLFPVKVSSLLTSTEHLQQNEVKHPLTTL